MTLATSHLHEPTLTRAAAAATSSQAHPLIVPGRRWRATVIAGDLLAAFGIVLFIPLVMLAIGTPIALFVRLVLWMVGMG